MKSVKVWDLPTRLVHWLLVAAIAGAYATGETGGNWLVWHIRIGLLFVGLISFRLTWGFAGSTYARFGSFVRGPAAIRDYLAGRWQGLGHNPLGALSVLALLALICAQFGTGLIAQNDDTGIAGPFYALVGSSLGSTATHLHHLLFDILAALVGLHVAAIVFYGRVKKENLLKAMITGHKEAHEGDPARGGGKLALLLALCLAGAAVYGASGIWLKPPPVAVGAPAA